MMGTYVCLGTEPECRRTVGLLNYIRVDDCQSEEKIELTYCEVSRCIFVFYCNNTMKLCTYFFICLFLSPTGKLWQQVYVLAGQAQGRERVCVLLSYRHGAHECSPALR